MSANRVILTVLALLLVAPVFSPAIQATSGGQQMSVREYPVVKVGGFIDAGTVQITASWPEVVSSDTSAFLVDIQVSGPVILDPLVVASQVALQCFFAIVEVNPDPECAATPIIESDLLFSPTGFYLSAQFLVPIAPGVGGVAWTFDGCIALLADCSNVIQIFYGAAGYTRREQAYPTDFDVAIGSWPGLDASLSGAVDATLDGSIDATLDGSIGVSTGLNVENLTLNNATFDAGGEALEKVESYWLPLYLALAIFLWGGYTRQPLVNFAGLLGVFAVLLTPFPVAMPTVLILALIAAFIPVLQRGWREHKEKRE